METSVLKLPEQIWGSCVVPMLKLGDVVRLDSALCAAQHRPRLCEIYAASALLTVVVRDNITASWMISRGLKFVSLVADQYVSQNMLIRLCAQCPTLQSLDIMCSNLVNATIEQITAHCTNLVSVKLGNWSLMNLNSIAAVARNCHKLHRLELKKVLPSNDSDQLFLDLTMSCPLLEDISLDLTAVSDQALTHFATHCKHLKRVALENSRSVGAIGLTSIAQHCPDLMKLSLSDCTIPDAAIIVVAEWCRKLQILYLYGVRNLTDTGLAALAKSNPGITSVTLFDLSCTGVSIEAFCVYCPLIETLKIDGNKKIRDHLLPMMAAHLRHLRILYLCDGGITNEDIMQLAESCRELCSLNIHRNVAEPVSDEAIAVLVRRCSKLKELWLSMLFRKVDLQMAIEIAQRQDSL